MDKLKVIAINGSPRKNFSTAKLLSSFTEGAKAAGQNVEVKQINLYDYNYSGCRECYLCKLKGGRSYAKCGFKDDITNILQEVAAADIVAFGAPIFFGDFSGQMKSFLERLFFPFARYGKDREYSIAPKKIHTAVFSAMNVPEEMRKDEYDYIMEHTIGWIKDTFGYRPETCYANYTYQFTDYDKFDAELWDEKSKREWRDTQFPKDCEKAFDIGKKLVSRAVSDVSAK